MTRFVRTRTTIRILAAIILGYLANAGIVALLTVLTVWATGSSRAETIVLIGSFSWIVWTGFFLWAFAARRLWPMLLSLSVIAVAGHWAAAAIEPMLPVTGGP